MYQKFEDRKEGGRALAKKLIGYKDRNDVVILALPRGGVPVGFEIAKELSLPLNIFSVRKLGVPTREELAFGAIASSGITVLNESIIKTFRIPQSMIQKVIEKEATELKRREVTYGQNISQEMLQDKTLIIVDDGIATGATVKAAFAAVRQLKPKQIIIASPVASREFCENINQSKNNTSCICMMTPEPFHSVGKWYRDFRKTSDEDVCDILGNARDVVSRQNLKRAA